MDQSLLKNIGLTDSEIKVYLALLDLGSSSTGPIIDKSKVASSKIYGLLEKLIQKGLVSSVIKSGTKYFEAASPQRIMDYVKEKEANLKEQERKLKDLIPQLELRRSLAGMSSETQVFRGMKGAKTAFEDILNELKKGDEYFVLGISTFTDHFERFVVNFHKRRAQKGIKCKMVINELAKDIGKRLKPIPLTQVRYLQKELFTPVVFILYKDKTIISVGLDEIFIQVTSKNLTEGLLTYAKYMYSLGKR